MVQKKAGLAASITDALLGGIFPALKSGASDLIDSVEKRAVRMQERIIRRLVVSVVNGVALLFLLFSLFYYLVEFRGLTRTHVFFILGVGLLLTAFVLKYHMLKQELR